MQIIASILAIATIATAAATPNMQRRTARVELESRQAASLCGPLDTPQCCSTDVLGVADLACTSGTYHLCILLDQEPDTKFFIT